MEGDSYRMMHVGVHCLCSANILSVGKQSEIVRVYDMGDTVEDWSGG